MVVELRTNFGHQREILELPELVHGNFRHSPRVELCCVYDVIADYTDASSYMSVEEKRKWKKTSDSRDSTLVQGYLPLAFRYGRSVCQYTKRGFSIVGYCTKKKQKVDGSDLPETHRNDYFMTVGHEKGEKMY